MSHTDGQQKFGFDQGVLERFEWYSDIPPHIDDYEVEGTPAEKWIKKRVLEYPCDPPGSYRISGPLGENRQYTGRHFETSEDALLWAQAKFGIHRVKLLNGAATGGHKWVIRVEP